MLLVMVGLMLDFGRKIRLLESIPHETESSILINIVTLLRLDRLYKYERTELCMSMNKNEEPFDLIAQSLAGNTASFGKLYEYYLDEIYQFVFYRVKGQQEAEDLTEAAFMKAWQGLDDNPPRDVPFRLWLYRIARNTIIDHYRTRKEHVSLDEALHVPGETDSPEMVVMHRERVEELKDNLLQLGEDFQEVIICRFVMGLSHSETAVVMARSEQAVRALQYRAIIALRNLITVERMTPTGPYLNGNGSNGNGSKNGKAIHKPTTNDTLTNKGER